MAPMPKRKRDSRKEYNLGSKKRRKLDEDRRTTAEDSHPQGKIVRVDQLAWKSVTLPDRMDDYDGFYGLEEIDDVEVVRDAGSGKIVYKAKDEGKLKAKGEEDWVQPDPVGEFVDDFKEDDEFESSEGEEWEGFSDKEEDDYAEQKSEALSQTAKNGGTPADDDQDEELEDVSFQALDAEEEEDEADVSAWSSLDLSPETLASLSKLRFAKPTPIQAASIPQIMAGHDAIGKAATGSGKTLAYGIPILEHFLRNPVQTNESEDEGKVPGALIIAPTRELAHQIAKHLSSLCSSLTSSRPSVVTITGGLSVHKQQRLLDRADIVVATPGRLWEVMSEGHGLIARFRESQFFIIDEADRLLSAGHFKELEEIINALDGDTNGDDDDTTSEAEEDDGDLKPGRQTLVFSATFHKGLQQKLSGKAASQRASNDLLSNHQSMAYLLKKLNFREARPKFIDVNPISQMASGLREGLVECGALEKDLYLYALLLHTPNPTRTLIFTNSISAVRRLVPFLANLKLPALPLHSQMPQKSRLRSVERFTAQPNSILVATDVAARGLDIPGVQLVMHYHLPRTADMYVHRSGRTARAEASGSSILLCAPEEVQGVRRLIAKVHAKSAPSTDDEQDTKKSSFFIRTLDIDRKLTSRLKPRTSLAKKIADIGNSKEKKSGNDTFFKQAAEELGVDYDSDEMAAMDKRKQGRGNTRKRKERENATVGRDEVAGLKAELRELLSERVNTGVSPKYITSGGLDVDKLLKEQEKGQFLGVVKGLDEMFA